MPLFKGQKAFDPYQAQREASAAHYNKLQGEYDSAMANPNWGMPDQAMQQMLEKQTEQTVRNQYPGAGRAQWLNSRISDELLKMRFGLLDKRQQSLDKIRQMQTQALGSMGGPAQPGGPSPAETLATKAMGQFAGAGAESAAESIFGKKGDKKGGMAVAQNGTSPGTTTSKWELKQESNT